MSLEVYKPYNQLIWSEFYKYFSKIDIKGEELKALNIPDDIKQVVSAIFGDQAVLWLCGEIPALDNNSPVKLVENDPEGANIIRMLLIRIHW